MGETWILHIDAHMGPFDIVKSNDASQLLSSVINVLQAQVVQPLIFENAVHHLSDGVFQRIMLMQIT
jgi:hypothetical protein